MSVGRRTVLQGSVGGSEKMYTRESSLSTVQSDMSDLSVGHLDPPVGQCPTSYTLFTPPVGGPTHGCGGPYCQICHPELRPARPKPDWTTEESR